MRNFSDLGRYSLCSNESHVDPIDSGFEYQTQQENICLVERVTNPNWVRTFTEVVFCFTQGLPIWSNVLSRLINGDPLSYCHNKNSIKQQNKIIFKKNRGSSGSFRERHCATTAAFGLVDQKFTTTNIIKNTSWNIKRHEGAGCDNINSNILNNNIYQELHCAETCTYDGCSDANIATSIANNHPTSSQQQFEENNQNCKTLACDSLHQGNIMVDTADTSASVTNLIDDRKNKRYRWRRKYGNPVKNNNSTRKLNNITTLDDTVELQQQSKFIRINRRRHRKRRGPNSNDDQVIEIQSQSKMNSMVPDDEVEPVVVEDASELLRTLISMQTDVEDNEFCNPLPMSPLPSLNFHHMRQRRLYDQDTLMLSEDASYDWNLDINCQNSQKYSHQYSHQQSNPYNYNPEYSEEYKNLLNETTVNKVHEHSLPTGIHHRAIEEYHTLLSSIEGARAWAMM